jgi:SH3-like domain-containing protein
MHATAMPLLGCLLLGPLMFGAAAAQAQSNTLQVPAQKPAAAAPKVPSAAPLQPVQQVGPSATPAQPHPAQPHPAQSHPAQAQSAQPRPADAHPPVVEPHGTPHAQASPTHAAKPAAKPQAATKAAGPSKPGVPAAGGAAAGAAAGGAAALGGKPADAGKAGGPAPNLPRFASLRFDEVNMRVGPGPRYPIDWVYRRRDLPVEVEREFDIWRLIHDADGIRGWVSQASLNGRRSFIVTGGNATLRQDASDTAEAVAILKPGVIGRIRSCAAGADWCEVQTGDYRGYLKRAQFWGTRPAEAVTP